MASETLPLFQVDAFTRRVFGGNPAAVCPLREWLDEATLQAIAAENNLSETAFILGGDGEYAIRWFTPQAEVDLCGHATLASAHVVLERLEPGRQRVRFSSASGPLVVTREEQRLVLDFPARPPQPCAAPAGLAQALGRAPVETWSARDLIAVYADEDDLRGLRPDMVALAPLASFAVCVTAPGRGCDFVSRFFAPNLGIPEDPVTGSSHCSLVPYWAARLGRTRLLARQLSARGGELHCELAGDRVRLGGEAALYLEGTLRLPPRAR